MKTPKNPLITIDPEMARYDNISLFPKKVAHAKEMLARTNLTKLHELLAEQKQLRAQADSKKR